jgi:hypothetical protein
MHRRRSRRDWVVRGTYIASVIVATEVRGALGLSWYVLAAYLAASTALLVIYYRVTR